MSDERRDDDRELSVPHKGEQPEPPADPGEAWRNLGTCCSDGRPCCAMHDPIMGLL